MDQDEKAQMNMQLRSLERRVEELERIISDMKKNANRDISASPALRRDTSRF